MDQATEAVLHLVTITRRTATALRVVSFMAAVITVQIVRGEIDSRERIASQIIGIGVVGAACVIASLITSNRVRMAAHRAAQILENDASRP